MSSIHPSILLDDFIQIAQTTQYNLIPIYQTYPGDAETAVTAFLKIRNKSESGQSFLLESIEGGEYQARYSYLGTEPYKTIVEGKAQLITYFEY